MLLKDVTACVFSITPLYIIVNRQNLRLSYDVILPLDKPLYYVIQLVQRHRKEGETMEYTETIAVRLAKRQVEKLKRSLRRLAGIKAK